MMPSHSCEEEWLGMVREGTPYRQKRCTCRYYESFAMCDYCESIDNEKEKDNDRQEEAE